jgi:hypothetical protein
LSPRRSSDGPASAKRQLRRLAELRAQRGEIAIRCELATRSVDHPDLHHEMRGHRHVVPETRRQRLAETRAKPRAQRNLERLASG